MGKLVLVLIFLFLQDASSFILRSLKPGRSIKLKDKTFDEAPESVRLASERDAAAQDEVDYIVVGSGIGGLSAAALLSYYGYTVTVLESHYLPGGVAHTFERQGFKFDAGPSLWNGMNKRPYNPLRELLEIVGEGDSVKYAKYDGWMMHTPDGSFKFEVGKDEAGNDKFLKIIERFGGSQAVREWLELERVLKPVTELSGAVPPLCLRNDIGVLLTLLPHFGKLLRGLPAVSTVEGSFKDASASTIKSPFLVNWFEFLSFALSGLPADGTIAAAVAYTMRDLHQKDAHLDYPMGGAAAVIDALIRGVKKGPGGRLLLNTHVEEIVIENGRATGVKLRRPSGKFIRARKAVISNASVWDTTKLLTASPGCTDAVFSAEAAAKKMAIPRTGSFVHLHLGIDATGLPENLESHYTVINRWQPIDSEQNHVIISIPSTLDPSLAPPGHHVIHAYAAANEPYENYESGKFASRAEYQRYKSERCDFLWKAVERSIPDVRSRAKLVLEGSPLTHERFNRRYKGSFGPALRAGKEKFPFPYDAFKIPGLFLCGDSVFPGLGVPAVAASGANAASSAVSVWEQLRMLKALDAIREG